MCIPQGIFLEDQPRFYGFTTRFFAPKDQQRHRFHLTIYQTFLLHDLPTSEHYLF